MKYVNRELKGTYGYIRKQTIFEIIKTAVLFAMALGIFFIGYLTLGTRKSLWSVFAVLALLPACKSLVGVIMLLRFRSLSAEVYGRYSECAQTVPSLYENILTTGDRTFYVPMLCCSSGSLAVYLPGTGSDGRILKEHIDNVLHAAGHSGMTVKVYENEDRFLERVLQMRDKNTDLAGNVMAVFNTIKAVSL